MNTDILKKATSKYMKKNIPDLRSGDVIRVYQKVKEGNKERIQIFEGVVISSRGGKNLDGTFTVRRVSGGIGVEKIFPIHLPSIVKIEKIKALKLRAARLYYLRNLTPKQIKRKARGEISGFVSWEEANAEAEAEAIKAEQEAEAKKRAEEEAKEEAKAQKAVEAAKSRHVEIEETSDDKKE